MALMALHMCVCMCIYTHFLGFLQRFFRESTVRQNGASDDRAMPIAVAFPLLNPPPDVRLLEPS